MKKIIFSLIGVLVVALLFGCRNDKANAEPTPVEKYTVTSDLYTFHADSEKYQDVNVRRAQEDLCHFSWEILNVSREDNILVVEISRPKDCDVRYEIIWDGAIMESYPMMANIFLKAVSDNCIDQDDTITDELVIDLEDSFKDIPKSTLDNTDFMIRDVCSLTDVQCVDDCNVAVPN
jgi:hypothetical protein